MDPESEDSNSDDNNHHHPVWNMNNNEYECDCPGPPPPEFVLPPPPAPPSAGYCADNGFAADMEYCDFKVLEGSFTQTAIPSLAVIVVCSVLMLVMLLVATVLLWKHKKKMQNFLPCKTSPPNRCDLSGANSVLYEDLTHIRPRTLPNHCVIPDQTVAPIEVGVPSQLKLLDVKCSNYGGAGFTPMNNTLFIYPPKDTDTIKSSKSREHFNPAYEEVSAGSEKPNGLSQDSDLESDEPPSVVSEDEFAEDELSLVDFPKEGEEVEAGPRPSPGGSGTSSLRGSTGDDLCRDLDSIGSEVEHEGGGHHGRSRHHGPQSAKTSRGESLADGSDARVRTVDRNRQQAYGPDAKPGYYDKEVPGTNKDRSQYHPYECRPPHPTEAELIEQLRQGAVSGVALAPQEFVNSYPDVRRALYPSLPGAGGGYYPADVLGPPPPLPPGRVLLYTPGVYGAGELGPKEVSSPAPPAYAGRKAPPLPPPRDADGMFAGGERHLPVPLISELNQKLQHVPHVVNQNGSALGHGSNRNSRSSSGSGSSSSGGARNSDPHERTLTEFSTFRPKRGRGRGAELPVGFANAPTTLPSRRGLDAPRPPSAKSEHRLTSEAQKLLPDNNSATPGRSRRPLPAEPNTRTVIT